MVQGRCILSFFFWSVIYVYIYIYICVCVCVCVWVLRCSYVRIDEAHVFYMFICSYVTIKQGNDLTIKKDKTQI